MKAYSLRISFAGLIVLAVSAWASPIPSGPVRIQGVVRDSTSRPVVGAELHIEAKDGSGFYRIAHTNANGVYAVNNLPSTDYEVTLFVSGSIKATIRNAKTFVDKPTQLDFKLKGQYASNQIRKHTHMVYVPAETGSNLGGHWVEVDDNTDIAAAVAGANDLSRTGNATLRAVQNQVTVPKPAGENVLTSK